MQQRSDDADNNLVLVARKEKMPGEPILMRNYEDVDEDYDDADDDGDVDQTSITCGVIDDHSKSFKAID